MKPPVIVVDGVDVRLCSDMEAAGRALEPQDVRDGVYEVYDSEGMPLKLEVRGRRVVVIEEVGVSPQAGRLEALLRRAIRARGDARAEDGSLGLDQLVCVCQSFGLA